MMIGWRWRAACVVAALIPAQVAAQSLAPPLTLPDPDALPYPVERASITDYPAVVTCDGAPLTPLRMEPLRPRLTIPPPVDPGRDPRPPEPVSLAFDIAADGRPHSVQIVRTRRYPAIVGSGMEAEAQATLLGWRFPSRALSGCRLEATAVTTPLAQTPEPLIARTLALTETSDPMARVLIRALRRAGDDCRPTPRRTATFPPPDIQPEPGTRAWTAFRYDIEADGRVRLGETLDSTADDAALRAVTQAFAETEFQAGQPRRGCLRTFERYGPVAPAGPIPMPDWRPLNLCTPQQRARFAPGRLTFPPALRDRGIEGWALVRFDIASWGAVGGIELIQAEPVQAFGDQALAIIRQGRATPAFEHAVGCVDRVVFRLGDAEGQADED